MKTKQNRPSLTLEQKARFAPMVVRTWRAMVEDGLQLDGPVTLDVAVELSLDSSYPVSLGGMSSEDYKALVNADFDDTNKWAASILRPHL